MCTSNAQKSGLCDQSQLGRFIINLPSGKSINDTSFWSARVGFAQGGNTTEQEGSEVAVSGFWNNPAGNPTPPDANSEYTSPWRRDNLNPSPSDVLWYKEPIQYLVRETGYYCVGTYAAARSHNPHYLLPDPSAIVPITVLNTPTTRAPTDVPYHPTYNGTVLFRNTFDGKLSASDYPKVNVCVHSQFSALRCSSCYIVLLRNVLGVLSFGSRLGMALLPERARSASYPGQSSVPRLGVPAVRLTLPQYYLSGLLGFLIIEMLANWGMSDPMSFYTSPS